MFESKIEGYKCQSKLRPLINKNIVALGRDKPHFSNKNNEIGSYEAHRDQKRDSMTHKIVFISINQSLLYYSQRRKLIPEDNCLRINK